VEDVVAANDTEKVPIVRRILAVDRRHDVEAECVIPEKASIKQTSENISRRITRMGLSENVVDTIGRCSLSWNDFFPNPDHWRKERKILFEP
jgi:hypothetical protein